MTKDKLQQEYEETFDGSEQLEHTLLEISESVSVEIKHIPVAQLVLSEFKKQSRSNTRIGLAASIEHWGVLTPIHVLALEDADTYLVLDGLRRVVGALRNGIEEVQCVVWTFDDVSKGKRFANILSLMLNKTATFDIKEQWAMLQLLEEVNDVTPTLAEHLLGLQAGEALKLKDIMLCENEYAEIREKMLEGGYNIEQAYKKLCNLRKKENRLEKDDNTAIANPDETETGVQKKGKRCSDTDVDKQLEIGGNAAFEVGEPIIDSEADNNVADNEPPVELDAEEVEELLAESENIADTTDTENVDNEVTVEDIQAIDKTDELRNSSIYQKVGQRHPIDPNTRTGTFIRDGFKCCCCGLGGSEAYLSILAFHHRIPVAMGGPDTKENGLTLCVNCHIMLHNYLMGKLQVDFSLLDAAERIRFKRIIQYGNIALAAKDKKKMTKKQLQDAVEDGTKHPMPNKYLAENKKAFEEAQQQDFQATMPVLGNNDTVDNVLDDMDVVV